MGRVGSQADFTPYIHKRADLRWFKIYPPVVGPFGIYQFRFKGQLVLLWAMCKCLNLQVYMCQWSVRFYAHSIMYKKNKLYTHICSDFTMYVNKYPRNFFMFVGAIS